MRTENTRPPLPGAGTMEDYTNPFLVVFALLCYFALIAIWLTFGLSSALVISAFANSLIPRR